MWEKVEYIKIQDHHLDYLLNKIINILMRLSLLLIYDSIKSDNCSRVFLDTLAYPYPGKSTILTVLLISNKFADCVRPGVLLIFANFFVLVIALMILDLPTLDLPTKQHSGKSALGIL